MRLAVLTNGRRYIVDRVSFPQGRVYCYGEVLRVSKTKRGLRPVCESGKGKTFLLEKVELIEVEQTVDVLNQLVVQGGEVLGHEVVTAKEARRRKRAANKAARAKGAAILGAVMRGDYDALDKLVEGENG